MARFILLAILLWPGLLWAVEVCWQPPTENVDGTPLTDLDAYRIYWGSQTRDYTGNLLLADETLTCYELIEPGNGVWFLAMTAIDAEGNESAYSNEVTKTIQSTQPLPVIILESDKIVYTVVKQINRFVLLPVGTVPPGTQCDPNESVNGYSVVPVGQVEWSPSTTVRPVVVVAQCDG